MKYILIVLAVFILISSCSGDESTTAPENPEPCHPVFYAESLQVEVRHIYITLLKKWVWEARATYDYELEGCRGKIHTHEFTFIELGKTFLDHDNSIADCHEPIDVKLEKITSVSTFDNLFSGYDSVTVYFTLSGLFQQCNCCSADSIAAISWNDTVVARVID